MPTTAEVPAPQVYTEGQAAEILRLPGARALRRLRYQGLIAHLRLSPRTVRYTDAHIHDFIARQAVAVAAK